MKERRQYLASRIVTRRNGLIWLVVVLFFSLCGADPVDADCGGSPAVAPDKPDYRSTESVVISGTGFECGELLSLLVTAPDGSSYQGQPGINFVEVRDGFGTVLAETNFTDGSEDFSCALTTAGGVKCWGPNDSGQLGNGSHTGSAIPVDVSGLSSGVVQITVGSGHACALTTAGGVKCWGLNDSGQLGNGSRIDSSTPGDVIGLTSGATQVSAGSSHTCAVTTSGGVKCWGANNVGQLGNGTVTTAAPNGIATPMDVSGLTSSVAQISAGSNHTCALSIGGSVQCWGANGTGQLGFGTVIFPIPPSVSPTLSATPVQVSGLSSGVTQITAGGAHTCAVNTAGGAKCWGMASRGQLGDGYPGAYYLSATPLDPIGLTRGVARISAGAYHTCALTTGGGAQCWGDDAYGQSGNLGIINGPPRIFAPISVSSLPSGVTQISAGGYHTCALTAEGGVKCWGNNSDGQLGTITTSPVNHAALDVTGLTSGVAALWDADPIFASAPWTFAGFYEPVETGGVWNIVKNGSTVPIKFQVFAGSTELTEPSFVIQPLTATQMPCSGGPVDTIELTAAGGTSFRYDAVESHFIYNWKTPRMRDYCYTVTVTLTDGTTRSANFQLR